MAQYIKSPLWTNDICEFVDENCFLFFGDYKDENSLEFTNIHNEFKELVDEKLSEFCEEYGVTEDQFLVACS